MTTPRIQFENYLPALYRAGDIAPRKILTQFLNAFQCLFEEVEGELEGDRSSTGTLTGGGIPDLFSVASTPPAQFKYRPQSSADNANPDFDFLTYLASWIGLNLRVDPVQRSGETDNDYFTRRAALNRNFITTASACYPQRGTLVSLDAMLRAWLSGELLADSPPTPIITDLRPPHTDATAVFQLGTTPPQPGANLGFDTVLGEGAPFLFVVDLTVDPTEPALRTPAALDTVQRAARLLLDTEKPAYTDYQLRVRAHPMQLAAVGETTVDGLPAAQIGLTTLLWGAPWVFNSD